MKFLKNWQNLRKSIEDVAIEKIEIIKGSDADVVIAYADVSKLNMEHTHNFMNYINDYLSHKIKDKTIIVLPNTVKLEVMKLKDGDEIEIGRNENENN